MVTPCLTCPNFCTTPDNLPDFEKEIQRIEEHIQMTQNYPIYNEKTKEQLDNLIKIRDQFAKDKSHRGDSAKKKSEEIAQKVEQAIKQLIKKNERINFNTVFIESGVFKSYLYKHPLSMLFLEFQFYSC